MATLYTPEIADIICARISEGSTLHNAIKGVGYPTLTDFYAWLRESEDFRIAYDIARECKADTLVEEMLDLADNCDADNAAVQKARVQIDTRKWVASRFAPKRYGEKVDHTGAVSHYFPIPIPSEERDIDALDIPGRTPTRGHSPKPN